MNNLIEETDSTNNVTSTKPISESKEDAKIQIKRGVVDSLSIYEVSESELRIIERGAPQGIFMNMFFFFISMSSSFFIVLVTIDFKSNEFLKYTFLFLTILGFMASIILLILWFYYKNEFKTTIDTIKDRIRM